MMMRTNEVIQRYHVSRKALLIYEKKGLIHPVKDSSGYRDYQNQDIHRLKKIIILRKMDVSLDDIADILDGKCEWVKEKRRHYEQQMKEIETRKNYLDYVYLAIENQYDLDEVIESMDETIHLDEVYDQKPFPFDFQRDGFITMWLVSLTMAFSLYQPLYIIITLYVGLTLLLMNMAKSKPYFLTMKQYQRFPYLLLLCGLLGMAIYFYGNNKIIYFISAYAWLIIFYAISLFENVSVYIVKNNARVSRFMIMSAIVLFGFSLLMNALSIYPKLFHLICALTVVLIGIGQYIKNID